MARSALSLVTVAVVVVLLGASAPCVLSQQLLNGPLDPDAQIAGTKFLVPECVPNSNGYLYTAINAVTGNMTLSVFLNCSGGPHGIGGVVTSQTVKVLASQPSGRYLIQPAEGSVSNRFCSLLLYGNNPYAFGRTTQWLFDNRTMTCGAAPNPLDDPCNWNHSGKPRYGYFEVWEQFGDNSWWNNAPCVSLIVACVNIPLWLVAVIWWFIYTAWTDHQLLKLVMSQPVNVDHPVFEHGKPAVPWARSSPNQYDWNAHQNAYYATAGGGPSVPTQSSVEPMQSISQAPNPPPMPSSAASESSANLASATAGYAYGYGNHYGSGSGYGGHNHNHNEINGLGDMGGRANTPKNQSIYTSGMNQRSQILSSGNGGMVYSSGSQH